VFSRESTGRCDVKFTVVNRNIQLLLPAKSSDDEAFCRDEGIRIADVVNNPAAHLSFLPDVMQFASASVASGELVENERTSEGMGSGTFPLAAFHIMFYVTIAVPIMLLFLTF